MKKDKVKKEPPSEVVKIRIGPQAKMVLSEAASKNYRSFQAQVRLVLDEWAVTYLNKKGGILASLPPGTGSSM
jgi:hypothetical protein